MDDGDDLKSVLNQMMRWFWTQKLIDTMVIARRQTVPYTSYNEVKCYMFRIASLQIESTISERVRCRCTFCCIIVSQTVTNLMINKKPYNLSVVYGLLLMDTWPLRWVNLKQYHGPSGTIYIMNLIMIKLLITYCIK